jgi:hypothetical protein
MDPLLLATTSTGSWLVAKYLYNNKKTTTIQQHTIDNRQRYGSALVGHHQHWQLARSKVPLQQQEKQEQFNNNYRQDASGWRM